MPQIQKCLIVFDYTDTNQRLANSQLANMFCANAHRRPMLTLTSFKSLQHTTTLFDFTTPINQHNFIINSTSLIYLKKQRDQLRFKNLSVVSKQNAMNGDLPNFEYDPLFQLQVQTEGTHISYSLDYPKIDQRPGNLTIPQLQTMPFICLNNNGRRNEIKSTVIEEGDYIKLGKTYLKVVQTHQSAGLTHHLPQNSQPLQVMNRQAKTCRICLMEDNEDMISPCCCRGSCQSVHISCLMIWLQNKVTRNNNRLVSTYNLSKFECQLCKSPLPNKIFVDNKQINFVEFVKPDEPYILLQKLEQNQRDRSLYVITPKDQLVRIGRANSSDLKIEDQTVSRFHSQIEFREGKFLIKDVGSKFGTLVLLRERKVFDDSLCLQHSNRIYKMESMPSIQRRP